MRVLIAEHDVQTAHRMQNTLTRNCMAVDMASDSQSAELLLASTMYDVLILERALPPLPGERTCSTLITGAPAVRTLMISRCGSSKAKVEGLVLGADDYLAKPFSHDELLARVRALGRRPATRIPPTLVHGDLRFDLFTQEVTRQGRPIELTLKERAVLETIMAADGGIVSSEELLEKAWDIHANPFSQVVKVTICALRRKLGGPPLIDNVRGQGYRLRDVDGEPEAIEASGARTPIA
jgi:DNA-binding response OmpR family regulator